MLELKNIQHSYGNTVVLDMPHFKAEAGKHALVLGLSGSGKTTFLHVAAGLLKPTRGDVLVKEKNLAGMSGATLDQFRGQNIGIVFQEMHLLSSLTVEGNLLLAQYLAGLKQDKTRIKEVLASLDMSDKLNAWPSQLSTGQKQRVTIARAVINRPGLILADEPTSSLDEVNANQVIQLLIDQANQNQSTLIITTHDQRVKDRFAEQITL